jgi:hypothetical protein
VIRIRLLNRKQNSHPQGAPSITKYDAFRLAFFHQFKLECDYRRVRSQVINKVLGPQFSNTPIPSWRWADAELQLDHDLHPVCVYPPAELVVGLKRIRWLFDSTWPTLHLRQGFKTHLEDVRLKIEKAIHSPAPKIIVIGRSIFSTSEQQDRFLEKYGPAN